MTLETQFASGIDWSHRDGHLAGLTRKRESFVVISLKPGEIGKVGQCSRGGQMAARVHATAQGQSFFAKQFRLRKFSKLDLIEGIVVEHRRESYFRRVRAGMFAGVLKFLF